MSRAVEIDYTNWRGERRRRQVLPHGTHPVEFCETQYHRPAQWILWALDLEDDQRKGFAMKDIHSWAPVP